jgi:hypothetical protein
MSLMDLSFVLSEAARNIRSLDERIEVLKPLVGYEGKLKISIVEIGTIGIWEGVSDVVAKAVSEQAAEDIRNLEKLKMDLLSGVVQKIDAEYN